jgi:CHAT domain-containing protein
MNYLLYGTEKFLIDKEVKNIINKHKIDDIDISRYDLEENTIKEILEEANTISLFSNKKLIIVDNSFVFSRTTLKKVENLDLLEEYLKIENKDVSQSKHLSEKSDSLRQCLFKQLDALQSQMSQLHITWQDIQKNLTKNDSAVEFICLGSGKDTEYAVILLRSNWNTPKVYYLNALAETLEAKQISRLQMHDNSIFGKLVWQHIIDEAKPEDRIYFVPAGELQLMAVEHFTIRENYRMNERYEMHRLSSTKQLLLPQNKSPHHEVALIGGMDYNASIEEISYYADQYGYNNQPEIQKTNNAPTKIWLPLPGALKEVQTIDSLITNAGHNSFLATHDAATDAAIFSLTGKKYDIIHIATHGFYADTKDDEMQKSGLVMAGANTLSLRPDSNLGDGILTIKELSNLNLKTTQLAVLSACQTGVGDITTEGVFGLQRAFKIAGVRSLIVSLWEVNDAVTAKLMTSFYKALLLNYDYYTAFSIAIENVRKTKFNIQGTSVSGDKIELFGAFVLVD